MTRAIAFLLWFAPLVLTWAVFVFVLFWVIP